MTKNIYQFSCEDAKGNKVELNDYQGKTLLIVNTASKCGFTPQYEGLEELQKKYGSENFSVLAFPCNQFGGQEPGSNEEIVDRPTTARRMRALTRWPRAAAHTGAPP